VTIKVFECAIHGECTIGKQLPNLMLCRGCVDREPRIRPKWVTNAQLTADSAKLAAMLPPEVTGIVGVARSGMLPATIIAMQLQLPLFAVGPLRGFTKMQSGWRLDERKAETPLLAIIDDTVASGVAMTKLKTSVLSQVPESYVTAAVYASLDAASLVDYYAVSLPLPHYLEWNLFNSIHSRNAAFDMDGVICEECPSDCDDDGPKYLNWLTNAKPLYVPRKYPAKLIVTARLEKYRTHTLAWLARHGVQVETLIMGQWDSIGVRREDYDAGRYKGGEYIRSDCDLFVESCPVQAELIAAASGKRVICPSAGRVWN